MASNRQARNFQSTSSLSRRHVASSGKGSFDSRRKEIDGILRDVRSLDSPSQRRLPSRPSFFGFQEGASSNVEGEGGENNRDDLVLRSLRQLEPLCPVPPSPLAPRSCYPTRRPRTASTFTDNLLHGTVVKIGPRPQTAATRNHHGGRNAMFFVPSPQRNEKNDQTNIFRTTKNGSGDDVGEEHLSRTTLALKDLNLPEVRLRSSFITEERISLILRRQSQRRSVRRRTSWKQKDERLRRITSIGAVPFDLFPTREHMERSFGQRDSRLLQTKKKRQGLIESYETTLRESIYQKEQHRLDVLNTKKMESLQRMWLTNLFLAGIHTWMKKLPQIVVARQEYRAAVRVQNRWRSTTLLRMARQARATKNRIGKLCWRLKFWVCCIRRRLHAKLLRRFFSDFSVQHLYMEYVMTTFRVRAIRAQHLMRSFIECKRARMIVLERSWVSIERELSRRKSQQVKKRQHQLALEELSMTGKLGIGRARRELASPTSVLRKGNNSKLRRALCKFHLEDERKLHTERAASMMKEITNTPCANKGHAKKLLTEKRSQNLFEDTKRKRKWPLFMPLLGGKERLKRIIYRVLREEEAVRLEVRERLESERLDILANRFDDDGSEESEDFTGHSCMAEGANINALKKENEELGSKYGSSPSEMKELREIFNLVDGDGGGSIDSKELAKLFDLLSIHKLPEEINAMIDDITDGQQEVNFRNFVRALKQTKKSPPSYTEELVQDAFYTFARRSQRHVLPSGHISRTELVVALTSSDGKWDAKTANEALRDVGLIHPRIHYRQFVHVMFQLCHK